MDTQAEITLKYLYTWVVITTHYQVKGYFLLLECIIRANLTRRCVNQGIFDIILINLLISILTVYLSMLFNVLNLLYFNKSAIKDRIQ